MKVGLIALGIAVGTAVLPLSAGPGIVILGVSAYAIQRIGAKA